MRIEIIGAAKDISIIKSGPGMESHLDKGTFGNIGNLYMLANLI